MVFRASSIPPAGPIMVLHRLSLVLLSLFLSHPQRPLCIAAPQSNRTGFTVEYTLATANSPDCEPSLVDNFPVRVQYRTIIGAGDGGQSSISVSEWMDSMSPNMPGIVVYKEYNIQLGNI